MRTCFSGVGECDKPGVERKARGRPMPQCKHFAVCGLERQSNTTRDMCILHNTDPEKDQEAFTKALMEHRKKGTGNFSFMVFPEKVDFHEIVFEQDVRFNQATFLPRVNFCGARFTRKAFFGQTDFRKEVNFEGVEFAEHVEFSETQFKGKANFFMATFTKDASFSKASFSHGADFVWVKFTEGVGFSGATFRGQALFTSRKSEVFHDYLVPLKSPPGPPFSGAEVDFRDVTSEPPDAVVFREADLQKCAFLDTDLRKVQMVGVKWPRITSQVRWSWLRCWIDRFQVGHRTGVYDEIDARERQRQEGIVPPWSRIEKLYRQLKQNYEDQRDHERAGDFHYGEKEMRRKNPDTPWNRRFFLTLYRAVSGYGERYLPPLLWADGLLLVSTIGYLWWGLHPKDGGAQLTLTSSWDGLRGIFYSFRVMTLLKPDDLVPLGYAKGIKAMESLLGPLFLGLFALAVRQRLKR
jgi:uncharacterized protein YjbI with pentapeptide repeats